MDIVKQFFLNSIFPLIKNNYEIKYSYFKNGDFGDLERIEFSNKFLLGTIEFWSTGWIGVHLVNAELIEEIINELLELSDIKNVNMVFKLLGDELIRNIEED